MGDSRDRPLGSGDLSLYILQFAKVLSFIFNKFRRFIVRPADGDLDFSKVQIPTFSHTRVALHYGAATTVKVSQLEVFSMVNSQAIISL